MRKYITSDLNSTAHSIKAQSGCSWGDAFNLSIVAGNRDIRPFLNSEWSFENALALAGHFWGLQKAYDEIGDKGRAIAMRKAAQAIYNECNMHTTCTFKVLNQTGVAQSILRESVDFYISSTEVTLTPRSRELIQKGAREYAHKVRVPFWSN